MLGRKETMKKKNNKEIRNSYISWEIEQLSDKSMICTKSLSYLNISKSVFANLKDQSSHKFYFFTDLWFFLIKRRKKNQEYKLILYVYEGQHLKTNMIIVRIKEWQIILITMEGGG